VDLCLGKLERAERSVRDMCCDLLTTEQRDALALAMGQPGWAPLYESCLQVHRVRAREELLTRAVLDALKPAGYSAAEWAGGGRLPRMTNLALAIVRTASGAAPDVAVAVFSQLLRDDQGRPLTRAMPVYCVACSRTPSRSRVRRKVKLASVQLRGSGPVLVHQPAAAPSGDALRIKREHGMPAPVGLLPPEIYQLSDPTWQSVAVRCERGHEQVLHRHILLAQTAEALTCERAQRYLGT
jgi:hypothetical protein